MSFEFLSFELLSCATGTRCVPFKAAFTAIFVYYFIWIRFVTKKMKQFKMLHFFCYILNCPKL